ncbi:hypothetical protein DERP_003195 [Dermatophagoides pteronyssinus]|uniref:Uncharacterized protein n=1 Tax=Dermatophagoides pteronyssinus TaxID=6956 RepID=A0ABQ8JIX0_DERPT|nr:hypothetical protein DERP_003195 [Dermatophagoides pteronyssinus]
MSFSNNSNNTGIGNVEHHDHFTMERELQNLSLQNSMQKEFIDKIKQQLQETETELQKSRHEYYEILQGRDNIKKEYDHVVGEVQKLRDEKIEMFELLQQKNTEISSLKETIQLSSQRSTNDGSTTLEQSMNTSLNEIRLRFMDNRFKEEKNLYQNQLKLLNDELENKTQELLNVRKENNEKLLMANLKIEDQADEIAILKLEINRLKKLNESKDGKNEELSNKLNELQIHCTQLESTYNKETEAQNEIINLLNKNIEEKSKESQEKDDCIAELRELIQKGYEAHNELELQFESMKESYMKDVKELEDERQKLLIELDNVRSHLNEFNKTMVEKEFEKHFPFASETNRKLNNVVNLSDLYDELVRTKQELTRVMANNLRLEKDLKDMNEKIDEERPLLYKNIHEYEMIEQNYQKLQEELMQLLMEKDKFMAEKDKDTQMINTLKRELKRYQQETQDLSLQIVHLMKAIQEAKGFQVFDNSMADSTMQQQQTNIPNGMILFKDIQELQDKNRQLLTLLHEMNDELMNNQKMNENNGDENVHELQLKSELEELKSKIESLRNELQQKNDIIEMLQKQKRLINPNYSMEYDSIEMLTENKELKLKLEKSIENLETTRQKNLDDVRRLESDKNQLIQENATIKSDQSRLNNELQNQKSYMQEVNVTMEKYQNENILLRERNIKLNSIVENLEKNIIKLQNQIDSLNESIRMKDNNMEFCRSESVQLKSQVDYLTKENERLVNDIRTQIKMVESMKMMQDNCVKVENDTIRRQQQQLERFEQEISYYRSKVQKQEEKLKEMNDSFTGRLENVQEQLNKERQKYLQLQQEHFDLKMKSQQQQQQQQTTMSQLQSSQNEMIMITDSGDEMNVSIGGKKELQMAQDEIKILRGKLNNSEEKCSTLETTNQSLVENLNKAIENNQQMKQNIDDEIQSKLSLIAKLNKDLKNLREKYEKIVAEKDLEIEQLKKNANDYGRQTEKLRKELNELQQALEKSHQNEHDVLEELQMKTMIADKAKQEYDSAIQQRNDDSKIIFELQTKLDHSQQQLSTKETELSKLREEYRTNIDSIENDRKTLQQECEKLQIKCGSLEQVNDSLMNQLEQMTNQIIALQNNSTMFLADEQQQKESSERLLSVVKFLREEKSSLQLEISKINDENQQLRIELNSYRNEIDNLKSMLEMERQSSQRLNTSNEFKEILANAQMVPILRENNVQLKTQLNQLERKCQELSGKLQSFESKEKSLQNLNQKTESEAIQIELLRKDIDNWKTKALNLQQQLRNFDADSVKRLMMEKTSLSKQIQMNNTELAKMKNELETKTRMLAQCEQELNNLRQQSKKTMDMNKDLQKLRDENSNLQNVTTQLRSLARKYKAEIGKIKNSATNASTSETVDKEVQCDSIDPTMMSSATGSSSNIQQQQQQEIESLRIDLQRLNQENESLKKHATDKEEIAKKIAQQAKQRISDLSVEKSSLLKEKEILAKNLEELRSKMNKLETDSEQLRNEYDQQMLQQRNDLQTANKQIEDLTLQLKSSQQQQQTTGLLATTAGSSSLSTTTTTSANNNFGK